MIHFQLRYLQTLNNISAENNSTVIFPVPIDIISHFVNKKMVRFMDVQKGWFKNLSFKSNAIGFIRYIYVNCNCSWIFSFQKETQFCL